MRTGNVTRSHKPDEDELRSGVCSLCKEKCNEIATDNSYDDVYGTVIDWRIGSNCCQAEVIDFDFDIED